MDERLNAIFELVLAGQLKVVSGKVQEALAAGVPAEQILREGMVAAMAEVGCLFEEGDIFVPEMLMSARAMQAGMAVLKPALMQAGAATSSAGKVVIGTVRGDMHDIGKNLVAIMLEGAGFEVVDLGVDVPVQGFVEAVRTHQPTIVGISALLTTTTPQIATTIQGLADAGLRDGLKIMVGGAPVTQEFADAVGADGYAPDAGAAARHALQLAGASAL